MHVGICHFKHEVICWKEGSAENQEFQEIIPVTVYFHSETFGLEMEINLYRPYLINIGITG